MYERCKAFTSAVREEKKEKKKKAKGLILKEGREYEDGRNKFENIRLNRQMR